MTLDGVSKDEKEVHTKAHTARLFSESESSTEIGAGGTSLKVRGGEVAEADT
jgi:hypothetical protein